MFCMGRHDVLEFAPHAFGESDRGRSAAETAIAAEETRAGEEAQFPTTLSAATEFTSQHLTVGRPDAFEQNLPSRSCVMVRTVGHSPWADRGSIQLGNRTRYVGARLGHPRSLGLYKLPVQVDQTAK